MRWIQKQTEPRQLTEWRSRYNKDINFGYNLLRQDHDTIKAVHTALLTEQGWLYAYTQFYGEMKSHAKLRRQVYWIQLIIIVLQK
jgi:hypothetical protein